MPIFIYRAKSGPKEAMSGEIEAASQDDAVRKLEGMGLVPISVVGKEEKGAGEEKVERTISGPPVISSNANARLSDVYTFTRQLASLVKSEVPMLRALSLISRQTEDKTLKGVVGDLERKIRDGNMLSEAMKKYPRIFNNLYLNMVKAGEKGGTLDEVLYRIADHMEKVGEIRRKIQAAMAYPLLIIVVGIGTIFVMLTYFFPKLANLFLNMKQELPLPTKILVGISNFMSGNWYWFLIALVFFFAMFGRVKHGSKKKLLFDMVKLQVPFINRIVKNSEIAKFARTLGMLIKNGISICESLRLATQTLDNDTLREHLMQASCEVVDKGSTLSSSLEKIDLFPSFAVNMIAVGEEGGKLDESLLEIADVYERDVEQVIKIMASLLEPLLILIVGAIVGFIVFAMLLPIFNIGIQT